MLCFTPTKSENNEEVDVNKCSKQYRDDSWVLEESRRHAAFLTCAFLVHSVGFTLPWSHLNTGGVSSSEMYKEVSVGWEPWVWGSNYDFLFNSCLLTTLHNPSKVQLSL